MCEAKIRDMSMKHTKSKGFSIIELLTVISIIGFLSSTVLATVNTARSKTRNAKRLYDTRQILNALALYYEDHGKFPCKSYDISLYTDFLEPLVAGGYLASPPKDPQNDLYKYEYLSFKTSTNPSAPCGQIAFLGIYTEGDAGCPTGGVASWSWLDNHCHILFPNPIPPPCTNPFFLDQLLPACEGYRDTVDDY